jgi:uracil-DNA glycosylase
MSKVMFIGQAPSRITEGSPAFTGNTGRKIAALMGISHADFLARFDGTNLLEHYPGKSGRGDAFDVRLASVYARVIWPTLPRRVVFVGKRVATAFGFADLAPCSWVESGDRLVALLPHPSGVNHWWNDAGNREKGRAFLRELAGDGARDPGSSPRERPS